MSAYSVIRGAMRRDEQAVLDYIRWARRKGVRACRTGTCWPPRALFKAQDRLEAAGVLIPETHFPYADTPRNRARGIHFRLKRKAQPVTEEVR